MSSIPPIQNLQSLQKQLNAIFAAYDALQPGYAATLPDAATQPDGRLYVDTDTQRLYQLQSGAWQLLA